MLIWPGGIGIADNNGLSCRSCPHTVRNDPVCGKIASADHISRPCGRNGAASVLKKGLFIAVGHKLGAGFAVGIGIIAIQIVTLPVAILPLPVLINLIRSHI